MDWVHCNGCYLSPPSKEYKFLLTSCGHIFCTKCYNAPKLPCLVCKNKCMITPLRPNMSPDVQLFFMDPLEVAAKLHKQLLKVLDFQKTQRKRLTAYRINNIKKSQSTVTGMQQELKRLTNENKQLKSLLAQAKENRMPGTGSRRPSPFGSGAPTPACRGKAPSPANSADRRMRESPAGRTTTVQ
ncbi:RING finger protein 212B-like [Bolinopsis microptera]|uniref:RING finger protein 212B-like n=1 Tax=Bolinopsis microptera TaxID=2820187 RepID=UPI0030795CAE